MRTNGKLTLRGKWGSFGEGLGLGGRSWSRWLGGSMCKDISRVGVLRGYFQTVGLGCEE